MGGKDAGDQGQNGREQQTMTLWFRYNFSFRYIWQGLLWILPVAVWLVSLILWVPVASIAADVGQTAGLANYPGKGAYEVGQKLAETTVKQFKAEGTYPKRICALVWGKDSANREGPMVSFVLALLGTKPQWDSQGKVIGIQSVSLSELGRPRIDATVVTTGQFRDMFKDEVVLMDRAFRIALAASYDTITASNPGLQASMDAALSPLAGAGVLIKGNEPLEQNYIARNWLQSAKNNLSAGKGAAEAGELAVTRIFAPQKGSFGAGIDFAGPVPERSKMAEQFISQIGCSYTEKNWGKSAAELFKGMLADSGALFNCRSNSRDGILDQDGFPLEYTYLAGLSAALEKLGGGKPQLLIGGWKGGQEQLPEPEGGAENGQEQLLKPEGAGQDQIAGQDGNAVAGGTGPVDKVTAALRKEEVKKTPEKPKPQTKAHQLQYLAEKEDQDVDSVARSNEGRQGVKPGRIFEVSASAMSLRQGLKEIDIVMLVIFLTIFLCGAVRKYLEYSREVAR
jgi:cobaltochelatase CobN